MYGPRAESLVLRLVSLNTGRTFPTPWNQTTRIQVIKASFYNNYRSPQLQASDLRNELLFHGPPQHRQKYVAPRNVNRVVCVCKRDGVCDMTS